MRIIVNGCFDKLHNGHMFILNRALRLAGEDGVLQVLLNSDKSVRELKGTVRPIIDQENRAACIHEFLGNWGSHDIIFFDTEVELLNRMIAFQPDMIVKGDDRTDVSTITGFGRFPILVVPRLTDSTGQYYSTTQSLSKQNLA